LDRAGGKQPIRIMHTDKLAATDRILVVALDHGARGLFGGFDDVEMIGLPFADRVRDLVPPVPEDAAEGTPAWGQA
jgi:hypothetical protein